MEQWRDAGIYYASKNIDLTGLYEVSSKGRVRGKRGLIKRRIAGSGQVTVHVYIKGEEHVLTVAKMMAYAWGIPNNFCSKKIRYKDGNKQNLSLDNLYWPLDRRAYNKSAMYARSHNGADWLEFVKKREEQQTWENGCYYRKFVVEFKDGVKEVLWARSSIDCRMEVRKIWEFRKKSIKSIKDFNKLCKEGVKL